LSANNSDGNQGCSTAPSIDNYEFDWHYICSQISVTNASRAIHNLSWSKVPPMSMTLQPEIDDSNQENNQYEDDKFFELVLSSGKQQNLIILSESSVGKSLFLAKFASYLHNNQKGYPLYISTSEFKQKSLLNYLFQNWLEDSLHHIPNQVEVSPELKNQFISLLENQQVYLLLDIDKFVHRPKQVILSVLESQSNSFLQKTNIILACKPQVWEVCQHHFDDWQSQKFNAYNILPLNEQQVQEFIDKRFTREPQLGEILQKRLAEVQDQRIAQLTQNPSYLVRLCDNWSVKQNRLTEEPKRLYERFQNNYSYWKFLILGN
jgi:hypothetical protein